MKKILSFAVLITVLFAGCKKENNAIPADTKHTFHVSALGFGDNITYTITTSYIAEGSTIPVVLEQKDIVGSVVVYTYSAELNKGDTFSLEIKSNTKTSVNYTVYDGPRALVDKRADNIRKDQLVSFKYLITN
jgi:hypothetical protein